jgi:hypothetical protein
MSVWQGAEPSNTSQDSGASTSALSELRSKLDAAQKQVEEEARREVCVYLWAWAVTVWWALPL